MTAYYNEFDPKAAAWLRELIKRGLIAPGEVDERSIADVQAGDLAGFSQHHFFAGIGVWSYALRCAGWPDDRQVWTGSCPCQPFSAAGKRGGVTDERHLWPEFFRLIAECRPVTVFGEQVASKDGLAWLDSVQADLEGADYTVGAVDTCAAGFGAPHIRQRLYFVGSLDDAEGARRGIQHPSNNGASYASGNPLANSGGGSTDGCRPDPCVGLMADSESIRSGEGQPHGRRGGERSGEGQGAIPVRGSDVGFLVHTIKPGLEGHAGDERDGDEPGREREDEARPVAKAGGACNGFWSNAEWLPCRDGKSRPVEPGTFPLAHGSPARVGRLRGFGNAIVAPQAIEFIRAYLEVPDAADSTAR